MELRKKRKKEGTTYVRPPEIEAALLRLYELPIEEVAARAATNDPSDPEYVPPECLVHFVRQSKANGDTAVYEKIFELLFERLRALVPVRQRRTEDGGRFATNVVEMEIQEQVLNNFTELLCLDRDGYEERLDYYEVKFNGAVKNLRLTAQRLRKRAKRHKSLIAHDESGEMPVEIEEAIHRFRNSNSEETDDFLFRERMAHAIRALPDDERAVIQLIQGTDFTLEQMAEVLNCTERTVRNRRDRAAAKLSAALKEEEVV